MKKSNLLIPFIVLSTTFASAQSGPWENNTWDHGHHKPEFWIALWSAFKDGTYRGVDGELWLVFALPFQNWEIEFEGGMTKELTNNDSHWRGEKDIVPHLDVTWLINVWHTWGFQVWPTLRIEKWEPELLKHEFKYFTLPEWLKVELWTILRYKTQNGFAFYVVWAIGNFVTNEWDSDFSGTARAWAVKFF